MIYNPKEYKEQDLSCKGTMRRRYDVFVERYKGYVIYSFIRGEWMRYSVEDEKDFVFLETDDLEEAKKWIDNLDKEE